MATQERPATSTAQGFYDHLGRPLFERAKNEAINRGIAYGWRNYVKPAWDSATGAATSTTGEIVSATPTVASEAGSGAAGQAAATGATNISGGALASEGLAGVGWGGAASLLAPVVMAYLQYQKGSGVNEPVRKQYETRGMGKMLYDMAKGKKIDPANTLSEYGIKPKYLDEWADPSGYRDESGNVAHGFETVDPRGYTPKELYEGMHGYGAGHDQTNGIGNSGYSDQQIDEMFGDAKGEVASLLGYRDGLPDYGNTTWDRSTTPLPTLAGESDVSAQYAALTESDKNDLLNRNKADRTSPTYEKDYMDMIRKEREKAELERLLGQPLSNY